MCSVISSWFLISSQFLELVSLDSMIGKKLEISIGSTSQ